MHSKLFHMCFTFCLSLPQFEYPHNICYKLQVTKLINKQLTPVFSYFLSQNKMSRQHSEINKTEREREKFCALHYGRNKICANMQDSEHTYSMCVNMQNSRHNSLNDQNLYYKSTIVCTILIKLVKHHTHCLQKSTGAPSNKNT
jgi:hypothetical protein